MHVPSVGLLSLYTQTVSALKFTFQVPVERQDFQTHVCYIQKRLAANAPSASGSSWKDTSV